MGFYKNLQIEVSKDNSKIEPWEELQKILATRDVNIENDWELANFCDKSIKEEYYKRQFSDTTSFLRYVFGKDHTYGYRLLAAYRMRKMFLENAKSEEERSAIKLINVSIYTHIRKATFVPNIPVRKKRESDDRLIRRKINHKKRNMQLAQLAWNKIWKKIQRTPILVDIDNYFGEERVKPGAEIKTGTLRYEAGSFILKRKTVEDIDLIEYMSKFVDQKVSFSISIIGNSHSKYKK